MAYEQVDFGRQDRFDNRILGSVGDTRHTITGPTPIGGPLRPQLSLVPERMCVEVSVARSTAQLLPISTLS